VEQDDADDQADDRRRLREEHHDRGRRREGGRLDAQSTSPTGLASSAIDLARQLDLAWRGDCDAGHPGTSENVYECNVVLRKSDVTAEHASLGVDALRSGV
jgi:hypothetical protein